MVFGVARRWHLDESNAKEIADALDSLLGGKRFTIRTTQRAGVTETHHGSISSELESTVEVRTLGAQEVVVIPAHRDYHLTAGTVVTIMDTAAMLFIRHSHGITKHYLYQLRPA